MIGNPRGTKHPDEGKPVSRRKNGQRDKAADTPGTGLHKPDAFTPGALAAVRIPTDAHSVRRARLARWLRLLAAPALLGAIVWLAGPTRIIETVHGTDPRWLALGLLMNIAANMIAALRWRELARWFGMIVARTWALVTYFHGVAVSVVLPGAVVGGDVLRAFALQRLGHPGLDASLSVLLDRLSGLWMLCVIGFLAIAWGADREATRQLVAQWPLLAGAPLAQAGLLGAGALLLAPWVAVIALRWWLPREQETEMGSSAASAVAATTSIPASAMTAGAVPAAGTGRQPDLTTATRPGSDGQRRLNRLRAAVRSGHAGPHYIAQIILSGIVQLLAIGSLVCAARALHIDTPFWAIAVCTVPILVLATLPISFGGWGTREAAAVLSLGAFGVPAPGAVMISVFYGLYGLIQALGGLVRHRDRSTSATSATSAASVAPAAPTTPADLKRSR